MENDSFEIIDCHIHPYLEDNTNFAWFNPLSVEDFVKFMKKCGISRACGSVIMKGIAETGTFKETHEMNMQCLKFRDKYPDFFIPGIHIHPDYPQESCAEVEYLYKNEGVRWIGELVGYLTNYKSYVSAGAFEIFTLLDKLNLPVNIHVFTMDEIDKICAAVPNLKIIVAHPGDGRQNIMDRIDYMAKYPNVYLDISGSGPNRWGILRYAIDKAGKDKFLFGTDFPLCNPAMYVAGVNSETLTDSEKKAIFSENFKRLAGLK